MDELLCRINKKNFARFDKKIEIAQKLLRTMRLYVIVKKIDFCNRWDVRTFWLKRKQM